MTNRAAKANDLGNLDDFDDPEGDDINVHLTVLTFKIGSQVFAVDVRFVREILDLPSISPLPNAPRDILGMTDVRGQAVAVMNLASRLGTCLDNAETSRVIVFEFAAKTGSTSLGVIADHVLRVRETSSGEMEPVPDTLSGWICDTTHGIVRFKDDGIALLLDIQGILCTTSCSNFDFD